MILIISTDILEVSTEHVMDWLEHFGIQYLRINGEDFDSRYQYDLCLNENGIDFQIHVDGRIYTKADFDVIWFRRFHFFKALDFLNTIDDKFLWSDLNQYLKAEINSSFKSFCAALKDKVWIDAPARTELNKVDVMAAALSVGLNIPETLICNNAASAKKFLAKHPNSITKPIEDTTCFNIGEKRFAIYTEVVNGDMPDSYSLSLLQENIIKDYEIRTFFLADQIWSMAIFSQNDSQTTTDFRRYNTKRPNRYIPYALPKDVECSLKALMRQLGLLTGSIDLLKDKLGKYFFLEVNPLGQFGMVSNPCNYQLEKAISKQLHAYE